MELVQNFHNSMAGFADQHLKDLEQIVGSEPLEGNCFYKHRTLNINTDFYNKRVNLFWCGTQIDTKVCEIGFNAGHSAMLFLMGCTSPNVDFTVFDIGTHIYVDKAFEYSKKKFPDVHFEYVKGNSIQTIPEWIQNNTDKVNTYDVVHVDGGHTEECIVNDMKNADILVKKGGIIVIDDSSHIPIQNCIDRYLQLPRYEEVRVLKTFGNPHRIIRKV